jgi:hypothetical protein
MRYFFHFIVIGFLFSGCTPLAPTGGTSTTTSKIFETKDTTYEPQIRTVTLGPGGAYDLPSVVNIQNQNLQLSFDDLQQQEESYFARIVHCNFDWTKSKLQDLDFLTQYNEFPINTFAYSIDTHVPYVHYTFNIPPVKLPGNYVVVVYRGGDKNDLILSHRFMVYDQRIVFLRDGKQLGAGSLASKNQQINFTVNYKNYEILNPLTDTKVSIRQNQRWDNMDHNVKPSFVREIEHELEYRFFENEKMFKGGNEFRFFDLRSLQYPGRNVAAVDKNKKPYEVYLGYDINRAQQPYAQYDDLNGQFRIDNLDYRNNLYANYSHVHFTLQSPKLKGNVYITGAFNYWNLNAENIMYYDSIKGQYKRDLFLKQGWYDYQYIVKDANLPAEYLEGSFYETENLYEIFFYYRPFNPQADLLIGYLNFEENSRQR